MKLLKKMTNRDEQRRTEMVDPSSDRIIYAAFPVPLKDAMKIAAQRWSWDRETWRYQTLLIQDAYTSGRCLLADLVQAYRNPPPAFQEVA